MRARYLILGAALGLAVLLLGAQAVRSEVGVYQVAQGPAGALIIDTRTGQLFDAQGQPLNQGVTR
jgi:hypothetical protein